VFTASGACEEEEEEEREEREKEFYNFDSHRRKNDSRTRIEGCEIFVLPFPFICSKESRVL
jgi:hypothetical protein